MKCGFRIIISALSKSLVVHLLTISAQQILVLLSLYEMLRLSLLFCWLVPLVPFYVVASDLTTRADSVANTDSLVFVQAIWRHGDRTPISDWPTTSSHARREWAEGLGELTKTGMMQQYRLGKWLRSRYNNWLSPNFRRDEIYIRSSDYNRTIMSALANMAGLFPPNKEDIFIDSLRWQPIPVHSVPKKFDKQLYDRLYCPAADKSESTIYDEPELLKLKEENKEFLNFLKTHSGIPDFDINKVWMLFDLLNCEYYHKQTNPWPTWVNQTVYDKVVSIYDKSSRFQYHTHTLRRLRGGPLLTEILENFKNKKNKSFGDAFKFYAYSAHDTSIATILASLNIFPDVFPLYAATVLIEMHNVSNQYTIELYYKNMTDTDDLFKYEIPGCSQPCTLEKLYDVVKDILPENWETECGLKTDISFGVYIGTIAFLAFTTLLFGGIIIADIFLKKRKQRDVRERLIYEETEEHS